LKLVLRSQRRKLETSFNYLKIVTTNNYKLEQNIGTPIEYGITYEVFLEVIKKVYPKKSELKTRILFKVLDIDGSNVLRKIVFW
jgi:hypothetical protein